MVKIKQNNIQIGDKLIPIVVEDDKIYYPISYIYTNILLKNKPNIKDLKENGYTDIVKFKINFDKIGGGGIQLTNCVSEADLIKILSNLNLGCLADERLQQVNLLLEYLNQPLIDDAPKFIDNYNYENLDNYTEYEKGCISMILQKHKNIKWQKCIKCNKYYPYHENFFIADNRKSNLDSRCRSCVGHGCRILHDDDKLNNIHSLYGESIYLTYKNHTTIDIYNHYIENNLCEYPEIIKNKDDYLIIIKQLYDDGKINKNDITLNYLINEFRLLGLKTCLKSNEIYKYLFGNIPNEYPWKYKNYRLPKLNIDMAKIIFDNYIKENNININDVYNLDYGEIIKKSRLTQFQHDILSFAMDYHDNKYPAYKFNIGSTNYWKDKEHRDRALKYLIEEDMKLKLEKIPLYLTITSIQNIGTKTMYGVLKRNYDSLFEWVNEVYPDVFDPKDFDINYMRNEFDSIDENTINDILRDNFDNVLYNPKHTKNTIKLLGKIPDWFIFTTTGVTIVEYFGMWDKKKGVYNSRTKDYIDRKSVV